MKSRIKKLALLAVASVLVLGIYGFSRSHNASKDSLNAARGARDAQRIENVLSEITEADLGSLPALTIEPWVIPHASVDVMRVRMEETYDIAGVGTDTVQLTGWIAVKHDNARPAVDETKVQWGTAVSDTEFVGLDLRGESAVFGPVRITLNSDLPSKGQVGKLNLSEDERQSLHNYYVLASGQGSRFQDTPRVTGKGYEGISASLQAMGRAIEGQNAKALLAQYDPSPGNTYFNSGAGKTFRGANSYVEYLASIFTKVKLKVKYGDVRVIDGVPNKWAVVEVMGTNTVVQDREGRAGGEATFHLTQVFVRRGANWVSKHDSFGVSQDAAALRSLENSAAACRAEVAVNISMPKLDLAMHTSTPVVWYSEVETIPPVGYTASVSHKPTSLVSAGRQVGSLTSGIVKFREVVSKVELEGTLW